MMKAREITNNLQLSVCSNADEEHELSLKLLKAALTKPSVLSKPKNIHTDTEDESIVMKALEKDPDLNLNVCCNADEQERESTLKRLKAAVKSPSLLSKLKNAFTDKKDDSSMLKALKKVTDLTSQAQELLQQADKTIDALHYKVGFTWSL